MCSSSSGTPSCFSALSGKRNAQAFVATVRSGACSGICFFQSDRSFSRSVSSSAHAVQSKSSSSKLESPRNACPVKSVGWRWTLSRIWGKRWDTASNTMTSIALTSFRVAGRLNMSRFIRRMTSLGCRASRVRWPTAFW